MRIGLGGGALDRLDEKDAFRLLDAARALGVTLVDVARSYGEVTLGRWQRAHGHFFRVVTKGGYGIDGVDDWTDLAIARGIDEAKRRLDRVDAFLLHSCPAHVLDRLDLSRAQDVELGYSGDNADLQRALDFPVIRVIEQSLSLLDGHARIHTLPRSRERFLIVKRALANAAWRPESEQHARYLRAALPDLGVPFDELFLRYAAYTSGVDVVLIGTARADRLERALACVAKGPLDDKIHAALAPALARCTDLSPI